MRNTGASFGFAIAAGASVFAIIDHHAFGSEVTVAVSAATAGFAPLHLP